MPGFTQHFFWSLTPDEFSLPILFSSISSIEFVFQPLSSAETRSDRCLDLDLLPRLWVSTLPCTSCSWFEGTKTRENNLFTINQGLLNTDRFSMTHMNEMRKMEELVRQCYVFYQSIGGVITVCKSCYKAQLQTLLTSEMISNAQLRAASASVFVLPNSSAIIATNSFFRSDSASLLAFSETSWRRLLPGTTKAFALVKSAANKAIERNSIMVR